MAENQNNNVEFTSNKDQHLKRSLKARHMNMIALGGAIGTGLFVAGGEVVSTDSTTQSNHIHMTRFQGTFQMLICVRRKLYVIMLIISHGAPLTNLDYARILRYLQ